jgi:hypothetical protein
VEGLVFLRPDPVSTALFVVLVVVVASALPLGVYFAKKRRNDAGARSAALRTTVGLVLWLGVTSTVVASGALAAQPMPRLMMFFASLNIAALTLALSPIGRTLAMGLPLRWLVGFQAFRLPLELILHGWAGQKSIPETMTWSGSNFDIVAGTGALVVFLTGAKSRGLVWAANIVGFGLLLNVIRVAVLSSPLPFAWAVEPPLQLAMHLPYAWVGTVCVAGAFAGHVILTRALMRRET